MKEIKEQAKKDGKWRCPVCDGKMSWPPEDYHICPWCMTEFGNDDADTSIEELRRKYNERKRV